MYKLEKIQKTKTNNGGQTGRDEDSEYLDCRGDRALMNNVHQKQPELVTHITDVYEDAAKQPRDPCISPLEVSSVQNWIKRQNSKHY